MAKKTQKKQTYSEESDAIEDGQIRGQILKKESDQSFADRLRELIRDETGSDSKENISAFARKCGLKESVIRSYLGGTAPGMENLIAIADACGVSLDWLGKGRSNKYFSTDREMIGYAKAGQIESIEEEAQWLVTKEAMRTVSHEWFITAPGDEHDPLETFVRDYNSGNTLPQRYGLLSRIPTISIFDIKEWGRRALAWKERITSLSGSPIQLNEPSSKYVDIPLYDVRAAAGAGSVVDSEHIVDVLHFTKSWIRHELHASPNDLYLIYVDGDSMEPTLRPGDVILVDHRDIGPSRDGIYVLRMDGALLVKRLQRLPGGNINVASDNASYEPFTINVSALPQDFAIVGRVVWSGRLL